MVRVKAGLKKDAVLELGLKGGDSTLADKAHSRIGRDGLIFAVELSGRCRQPRLNGLPSVQTNDGSKAGIEGGARLSVDPDAFLLGLDPVDASFKRSEPTRGRLRRRV
jgi:hypothetical protein